MLPTSSIQRSDYSFGIIPIRYVDKRVEFLLIKHQLGHWGFPKGHLEGSETAQQAALRELQEETNLTVKKIHTKGPIIENYTFEWGEEIFNKEVQYWLATVVGEIKLQEQEIQESSWLNYEEALERCEYKESKATVISAQKILSNSLSLQIFNS